MGRNNVSTLTIYTGADVHMRTHDGDTCLYLATYGILNSSDPDVELLQDLCKAGKDDSTLADFWNTVQYPAAIQRNSNVILHRDVVLTW